MRVGLYGGSFNPVHDGHLHVARTAARALGLDRVVWLVSPGNPLKTDRVPLEQRLDDVRRLARDPRFLVTGVEADLGSPYTIDTLLWFKRRYPGVRFVWLMGSDNLLGFRRWKAWKRIIREIPVVVVARPGSVVRGRTAPAWGRIRKLGQGRFLDAPLNRASSTELRERARH